MINNIDRKYRNNVFFAIRLLSDNDFCKVYFDEFEQDVTTQFRTSHFERAHKCALNRVLLIN